LIWGERFPRPRSQQPGSLRPRTRRVALRFLMPNPAFGGQFGPENKLIEGQPNEYDVICRNISVLAFHLWPTIFARAPFRLQNICWNGVPPRSRTTTPLLSVDISCLQGAQQQIHRPPFLLSINGTERRMDGCTDRRRGKVVCSSMQESRFTIHT